MSIVKKQYMGFTLSNSLRNAISEQRLPSWVCDICDVPHSTTVAELPYKIETDSAGDLRALEHYFTTMLTRRMRDPDLKSKKCLPHSNFVLDADVITQMDLSNRTRNCLSRFAEDLEDGMVVNDLTFGDLTSIPNLGAKSVIEFLAYMENFNRTVGEIESTHPDSDSADLLTKLNNLIFEMRWQPWTREIVCGDSRFPQIVRPIGNIHLSMGDTLETFLEGLSDFSLNYPAPLVKSAIEILESVREKADALEKMPLDEVLKDFIKAQYKRGKQQNLEAMYARFGLIRESCLTLEEAGQIAGVTRERIRQIESMILKSMIKGDYATFMPGLDKAISMLNNSIGCNVLHYSDELNARGITNTNISADAIILFAKICNRDTASVSIKRIKDGSRVISSDTLNLNRVEMICHRLFSRNGIADIKLAGRHFKGDEEQFISTAQKFLSDRTAWLSLDAEKRWWIPNEGFNHSRNRLINITRKILSVSNPISVDDLREGYLRAARFRNSSNEAYSGDWAITVPSRIAILKFFEYLQGYSVDGDRISTDEILDYREELGDVEKAIVESILNSPTGILTRNDIIRECSKRGINENSLMLYTTYSPVIHRMAQETFKLNGKEIAASALSAHQTALSQKIRSKRILIADWKNGRIRLCVRCPENTASMVIGVPASVRDFLRSRNFDTYDLDDNRVGAIGSNEAGSMWGMGNFCQTNGLERDDILTIEFDLAAGKAYLYQSVLSEILDDI